MVCKQCGNQLEPNAKFCMSCGAPVEMVTMLVDDADLPGDNSYAQPQYAQPQYAQPQYAQPEQPQYAQPQYEQPQYEQPQYEQPQYDAAPADEPNGDDKSKSILTMGILAIVFGGSFLGIIFGLLAKKKAKANIAAGYPLAGRAKVGNILGTVGLIFGIISTVLFVVFVVLGVTLGVNITIG